MVLLLRYDASYTSIMFSSGVFTTLSTRIACLQHVYMRFLLIYPQQFIPFFLHLSLSYSTVTWKMILPHNKTLVNIADCFYSHFYTNIYVLTMGNCLVQIII